MRSSATTGPGKHKSKMSGTSSSHVKIIRNYLTALEQGDLTRVVAFFSDDSFVFSPLQGKKLPPADFFPQVFEASAAAKITLLDIFSNSGSGNRAAAYFQYDWTLPNGVQIGFEAVDIFEFSPVSDEILSLTALYDTHPLRGSIGDQYG
jgi:hypothetical protein